MIPDRDLDARLADAAGVRDEDLPALPEGFLATITRDDAARDEPASVIAARQLVTDAHDARSGERPRRRRPGRTALLRTGVAVVGIAAAWATAVVVAPADPVEVPDDRTAAPSEEPVPPAGPVEVDGMTLVATEGVAFPFSLDPEPEGLTPSFGRSGGPTPVGTFPVTWGADYRADDGAGFTFSMSPEDPRAEWAFEHVLPQDEWAQADVSARGRTEVDGIPADFVSGDHREPRCRTAPSTPLQTEAPGEVCTSSFTDLIWEREDGQWVLLRGEDEYADTATLLDVAESIVDRPRPVDLQLRLAPAGWTLNSFDDSSIGFVDPEDPGLRIGVSLMYRWRGETVEEAFGGMSQEPDQEVEVDGRRAKLVRVQQMDVEEWFLAAQLDSGVMFMIQTPGNFTPAQVVEIAEQVTYTP